MYVCQSVSWLTFLLKLDKYRDISSSVWDIFLKFFGGIPGMFVHLFQIVVNFLYVCQSVSWLTSLLKLFKYRDISSSGRDIFLRFFWRHSWDVGTLIPNNFEILVCLSVGYLAYFLTEITQIKITPVLDEIFFWNFLETFLGFWYNRSKYFWFSSMSVSLLVGLLPYWN